MKARFLALCEMVMSNHYQKEITRKGMGPLVNAALTLLQFLALKIWILLTW